ncbi:MAG: sigma-70 family RNA polymerase sigma factor [Anaerolineae bacterium]|nr:sigma-70 family RNA polymerase sigma factor [Anaerolineae bacterium]
MTTPVSPPVSRTAEQAIEKQDAPENQTQEKAWALAAQNGDSAAFMHIVDAYQRPVFNLCYRMLGDAAQAEDAAQETFLRVYTRLETYNHNRKFSSWLLSIASHYCIDQLRRRRYQMISWDDLPPWRWLPTSEPEPEDAVLIGETHETLRSLLDNLPSEHRAAIILYYWHDLSYEEIAETLETTVSAIKSRLFRARQMMIKESETSNQ